MKLIRRPRAEWSRIWFSKLYLKNSVIASSFQRSSMRSWCLLHGGTASASCLPSCCCSGPLGHGLSKSRAGGLFWISTIQFSYSVMFTSLWPHGLFPVHHQLPQLAQTYIHLVGDAIQPFHPLSSPFPPAFNLSQHHGLFKWVISSHQVAKALEFQL